MAYFEPILTPTIPRVAVLLATHNGVSFLADQVDSIESQKSCSVHLWVSDDQSTDGTWELLCARAKIDTHMTLLPRVERLGNAARNFYRLLSDVDFSAYNFVALSDQDDIWFTDKLAVCLRQLNDREAAAVSSNVIALWPDGRKELIRKSQKQRRLDFLFESAGPGCTYVLTVECLTRFQSFLTANRKQVEAVQFHDWMLYAWTRSRGYRWHIEASPTMYYRQHEHNEYGANIGWSAFKKRIVQVRSGWYREQILQISGLIADGPGFNEECVATIALIGSRSFLSRISLALKVSEMRRNLKDRLWLVAAFLVGGV